MDIKNLVEYQHLDAKLYELEKSLTKSPNRERCVQLSNLAKESQTKSSKLEEQASQVSAEIREMYKQAENDKKKAKSMLDVDVDKLEGAELDKYLSLKESLNQNLSILDKKATKLAENVNTILAEFNKTIKNYNIAKEKYVQAKSAYDKEVAEVNPKIKEIEKELSALAKNIDSTSIEEYKKRRGDKIFPVLVPLNNHSCGGCHMEIPASYISKLEEKGYLICENCRRIIYKK